MNHRPYLLLAELTYRCPLHCPYCSNPCTYPTGIELSSAEWRRVFEQAFDLGALHVGLSGGEPLQRKDIVELVAGAHACGLYTNLITSGIGLTRQRARKLQSAGLDSVQISFQADDRQLADQIAGTNAHLKKVEATHLVREIGLPLTLNFVLHRTNIDRLTAIIAFAETLGAARLELANTQFYGWAFRNRQALLPTRNQVSRAAEVVHKETIRLAERMEIRFVPADYYSERPKPCMNGWGRRYLTVNPSGDVLPCPTAGEIKGLRFDTVRAHPLSWIWMDSEAFNRFRGTEWMPEPCRGCSMREVDFGGCRCQAALITGDPAATDPVCSLSPHHATLARFIESVEATHLATRPDHESHPPEPIEPRRNAG